MMQDWQLLREYVDKGSQAAFTMLVERHVNLVYSTCLRELGDPALAEDVTQVVFLILAKKAATMREGTVIAGWLFNTARFASKDTRKQEVRRQRREQKAVAEMIGEMRTQDASWSDLEPLLHDGLARLGNDERNALILRFFEGKSVKETSVSLGVSPEAAQKRISRALDKLRRYFARHGYSVATTMLIAVLAEQAVQAAPATCVVMAAKIGSCVKAGSVAATGLGAGVGNGSTAGSSVAGPTLSNMLTGGAGAELISGKVLALSQGVLKSMLISQLKVGTVACMGLTLSGAGAGKIAHLAIASSSHKPAATITAASIPPANPTIPKKQSPATRATAPRAIPYISRNSYPLVKEAVAEQPQTLQVNKAVTSLSPRLAQGTAESAAPNQSNQEFKIGAGEIRLQGRIRSVDVNGKKLSLEVTTFTLPNGKVNILLAPKTKTILIDAQTAVYVRGDAGQKIALADLVAKLDGAFAVAIGKDLGSGQPLPAREVAIWERVEEGQYRFSKSPTVQNSLDNNTAKLSQPAPVLTQTSSANNPDPTQINFLSTPLPGQWFDPTPLFTDPEHAQSITVDNQPAVRLINGGKKPTVMVQRRFKLPANWKAVRLMARVKAKLEVLPQYTQLGAAGAWVQCVFEDADRKLLGQFLKSTMVTASPNWTMLRTQGQVPPKATHVKVMLMVQGANGSADFSDIILYGNPDLREADPVVINVITSNVFPYGDFEKIDAKGLPVSWEFDDVQKVKNIEDNGNHFLRISGDIPQTVLSARSSLKADPSWKSMIVTLRMRATQLKDDKTVGRLNLLFIDANERVSLIMQPELLPTLNRNLGWVTVATRLAIPGGTAQLRIQPEAIGVGVIEFDNITILPNPRFQEMDNVQDGPFDESFEKLDKEGKPIKWGLNDTKRALIEEEEGNHFLRLRNDKAPNYTNAVIRVRLQPNWKRVKLSARMRATNLRIGTEGYENARLSTQFKDAAFNRVGGWPPGLELRKDADWLEMVTEMSVPPGAEFMELTPQMINTVGEVDFDDIKFTAAAPLDPLPIRPGMPEGTFEQLDNAGNPAGWSLIDPRHVTVVEEDGNHFLRIANTDQPVLRANGVFQIDPTWKKLKLRVRMRARNLESARMGWEAAELAFDFLNANGSAFGPIQSMPSVKANTNWVTQEVELKVPEGAQAIMLKPEMVHKFGVVDFDDIRLVGE